MIGVLISVLAGIDVIILVIVTTVPELRTTAILKQSTEYPQIVSGVCLLLCSIKINYVFLPSTSYEGLSRHNH